MKSLSKLMIGALASLGILASAGLPASAATTTVETGNLQGWAFFEESPSAAATSAGSMVTGPGSPPIGVGSANLSAGATGAMVIGKAAYLGTRLDTIHTLEYSTYRTVGPAASSVSLQFNIDNDVTIDNLHTDGKEKWQGRLVYEPYHTQTVATGQWQTWDTLAETDTGNWWGSPNTVSTLDDKCPQSNPCTWAEVLGFFPNMGVHSSFGAVLLKAGSGGGPMDLNVDKLVINDDIYDFEPTPASVPVDPIDLGSSADYSLLAGAAITTGASNVLPLNLGSGAAITTGADNEIIGNLNAGAAITTGADNEISGNLNAGAAITTGASNTLSGSQSPGLVTPIASFSEAMASLDSAMADAISRSSTLLTAELGATTLESGVYSAPAFFTLTGSLTLDAKNDPEAVFIIRSPGYISTAAGASIVLANGAQASNVFLITGSYFSAGAGAELAGNIMATSYVTLGADAGLKGRILSQSGYITLGANATLEN
jgi:hypothetical protein